MKLLNPWKRNFSLINLIKNLQCGILRYLIQYQKLYLLKLPTVSSFAYYCVTNNWYIGLDLLCSWVFFWTWKKKSLSLDIKNKELKMRTALLRIEPRTFTFLDETTAILPSNPHRLPTKIGQGQKMRQAGGLFQLY